MHVFIIYANGRTTTNIPFYCPYILKCFKQIQYNFHMYFNQSSYLGLINDNICTNIYFMMQFFMGLETQQVLLAKAW